MAVARLDGACLAMLRRIEAFHIMPEPRQDAVDQLRDGGFIQVAEPGEEIVSADVAQERPRHGARLVAQQIREQGDGPVALPEAVGIVERFEIVEVEIDDAPGTAALFQAGGDVVDDRIVAGQFAERILVARLFQVLLVDDAQQGIGGQEADILEVLGDQNSIIVIYRSP